MRQYKRFVVTGPSCSLNLCFLSTVLAVFCAGASQEERGDGQGEGSPALDAWRHVSKMSPYAVDQDETVAQNQNQL